MVVMNMGRAASMRSSSKGNRYAEIPAEALVYAEVFKAEH